MELDLNEIERQLAELQAKKEGIIKANRATALEEVRKTIRLYSFKASELGLPLKSKTPKSAKLDQSNETAPAKSITFRDEASGLEWDGELTQSGRKPKWISERVKDGTIENFRVKAA